MTPAQAAAFRQRWALVNAREQQELRAAPLEVKFAQLVSMFQSARGLGWATTDEGEVQRVRERWLRLWRRDRG